LLIIFALCGKELTELKVTIPSTSTGSISACVQRVLVVFTG